MCLYFGNMRFLYIPEFNKTHTNLYMISKIMLTCLISFSDYGKLLRISSFKLISMVHTFSFLYFWDMVSLCSSGWPCAPSVSWVLKLQVYISSHNFYILLIYNFIYLTLKIFLKIEITTIASIVYFFILNPENNLSTDAHSFSVCLYIYLHTFI